MARKQPYTKLYATVLVFMVLTLTAGLAAILIIGTTSRYMADDYCYTAILRGGFFERQVNAYLHETTFSGNRFSLTLFTGISDLFGPFNIRFLPPTIIILWLICLFFSFKQFPWFTRKDWTSRLETLVISEVLVLFTLGMAPNWVQVYFWRAGMFPYLAPLVTGSLLIGLLAKSLACGSRRSLWLVLIFVTAFLTGGFSEIGVMVELAMLIFGFAGVWFYREEKKAALLPFGLALIGCLLALSLILFSPMNQLRMQRSYGEYSSFLNTLGSSIEGAVTFYLGTLYRQTLYYIAVLLLFSLLGWGINLRVGWQKPSLAKMLFWLGGILAAGFLIIVAAMIPGFFAESSYPSDRALIVPRFISLLLALALGFLAGGSFARIKKTWILKSLLVLAVIINVLVDSLWLIGMTRGLRPPAYPEMRAFLKENLWLCLTLIAGGILLGSILAWRSRTENAIEILLIPLLLPVILIGGRFASEYSLLHQRAALWDEREGLIKEMIGAGQSQLVVPAMNSLSGILELSDNAGFWVNNCAAAYYGVETISAVEPVLDPVQLDEP